MVFVIRTARFLKAINAPSPLAESKKLVAIGDGCTTTTSIPSDRTSAATDAANMVMNAFVDAYIAESGLGTNPADDEVKPMYLVSGGKASEIISRRAEGK